MRTTDKISQFLKDAEKAIAKAKIDILNINDDAIKDSLYQYTNETQLLVNKLFSKIGIITDQEINELDEQLRNTKKKIELEKIEQTKRKIYISVALVVVTLIALSLITKKR